MSNVGVKCPGCGGEAMTANEQAVGKCYDCQRHDRDTADLRRQLASANETIDRLQEYGIDTKNFGDGDANALWNRVDAFRNDPEAVLVPADVRELAEWWAELHSTVSDLDEKLCNANDIIEKLPKFLDEVSIVPGMAAFCPWDEPCVELTVADYSEWDEPDDDDSHKWFINAWDGKGSGRNAMDCYSTKAAAEAARGEK